MEKSEQFPNILEKIFFRTESPVFKFEWITNWSMTPTKESSILINHFSLTTRFTVVPMELEFWNNSIQKMFHVSVPIPFKDIGNKWPNNYNLGWEWKRKNPSEKRLHQFISLGIRIFKFYWNFETRLSSEFLGVGPRLFAPDLLEKWREKQFPRGQEKWVCIWIQS